MTYPNRAQWRVLWVVAILICLMLFGYSDRPSDPQLLLIPLIIGGLLFWRFSRG